MGVELGLAAATREAASEAGEGARLAVARSRGRRAEGRRCRRRRRLTRGDTDAGSGQAVSRSAFPPLLEAGAEPELQPGRVCGGGGAKSTRREAGSSRGAAGAGGGREGRADLGTRSHCPSRVQLVLSVPLSSPQRL